MSGKVRSGVESLNIALDVDEYQAEVWSRFMRLDYIRENGLVFDEEIIHEDVRFSFFSVLYAKRVKYINETLLSI